MMSKHFRSVLGSRSIQGGIPFGESCIRTANLNVAATEAVSTKFNFIFNLSKIGVLVDTIRYNCVRQKLTK